MTGLTPAKQRVAAAYSLAADGYDGPAMGFWQRFGHQLVELSEPRPGDRVLDLCCGSGASALAAARKVGPTGRVLGVDISDNLLTLARGKANRESLSWAEFEARSSAEKWYPTTLQRPNSVQWTGLEGRQWTLLEAFLPPL